MKTSVGWWTGGRMIAMARGMMISVLAATFPAGPGEGRAQTADTNASAPRAELIDVRKIWEAAPHNAFTDLIRFSNRWYCAFREGGGHIAGDGKGRILVSDDGEKWESAALLTAPGDVRDPKLSVTPDGRLMSTTAAAFYKRKAGETYEGRNPHQSLAWFSADGRQWGDPVEIGELNWWLWRVTWHKGVAYGVGYGCDTNPSGNAARLYRSADGKKFDVLVADLKIEPSEASLLFLPDDTALCLSRRDGNPNSALLGTASPPYTQWAWKDLGKFVGGPQLIRLPDGSIVVAGRKLGVGAKTCLWWLDRYGGRLSEILELPSGGDTSYPGLVFHDGLLWVSYYSSHEAALGKTAIHLAKVRLPPPPATVVLDTAGFWRCFGVFRPPVLRQTNGALQTLAFDMQRYIGGAVEQGESLLKPDQQIHGKWLSRETPVPPADWMQPDFDDSGWTRMPGKVVGLSPFAATICARGKFTVTDAAKAGDLRLALCYRGGAVLYVNGREMARGHLKPGPLDDRALAEDYDPALPERPKELPEELSDIGSVGLQEHPEKDVLTRRLEAVIPAAALRKGTNVLAIRLYRAPYRPKDVLQGLQVLGAPDSERVKMGGRVEASIAWASCALLGVRLESGRAEGVVPNTTRPRGIQVWNSNLLIPEFTLDYGDPSEPLRPVLVVGTRNGAFSGKVAVGSDGPLRGLSASVSDLRGPAGMIPAAAVQLRYALPGEDEAGARTRYIAPVARLDRLAETCPEQIPAVAVQPYDSRNWTLYNRRQVLCSADVGAANGAVAGVWLTVHVPADAAPGEYRGTLTVRADGLEPTPVPVILRVSGWRVPGPKDFTPFVSVIESPESVALKYGVPFWSDRHFELIGRSFRLLSQLGIRVVYLPLVARSNMGNAQAMLRWVEQKDGSRRVDVSVLEKYLDCALTNGIAPTFVLLYVAEAGFGDKPVPATGVGLDGKVDERFTLPPYQDPKAKEMWKAALEAVWPVLKARSLADRAVFGIRTDGEVPKAAVQIFKELSPGTEWTCQSHWYRNSVQGEKIRYGAAAYYGAVHPDDPAASGIRFYGWQQGPDRIFLPRNFSDGFPMAKWRHLGEMNIAGLQRGFTRLGADFWKVLPAGPRPTGTLSARYPETGWGQINMQATALLAPGADGAEATARFEMLREGLQECEARIFIERVLLDEQQRAKIGEPLAVRAQAVLDERIPLMRAGVSGWKLGNWWTAAHADCEALISGGEIGSYWFAGSGWEARAEKLFEVAAEIAGKLGVP